jgi:hypothetical protein
MSLSFEQWKLANNISNDEYNHSTEKNDWFVGALFYKKISEKTNEKTKVVEFKCLNSHFEFHYELTERGSQILIDVYKTS